MNKRFGASLSHRDARRKISRPAGLGLAAAGILSIAAGARALTALTAPLSPQGTIVNAHKVTSVVASFVRSDPGSNDTVVAEFSARISLTGSGNEHVRYRWRRSDGGTGPWTELQFSGPGTQTVSGKWTIGPSHAGQEVWECVETNYPNAVTSNQAKFIVPALGFKVTGVLNSVSPTSWTGICPKIFTATSQITVVGSGTVKYRWVRSDGGTGPQIELPFSGPATKSVSTTWKVSSQNTWEGFTRWITVEILYPNHILPPPNFNVATAPLPDAAAFGFKCTSFAENPNVPVQMSVSISRFAVQPSYNCNTPSYRTPTNMMGGSITLKNLSSNPLIIRKNMGSYWQSYVWLNIIYPAKKEFVNQTPPWPYIDNTNWYTRDIDLPEQIAPHAQYEAQFGACLENFDKHAVIFVGARHENTETGQKTFSNLVKWEKKF